MNSNDKQKIENSFSNVKTDVITINETLRKIILKINHLEIENKKLNLLIKVPNKKSKKHPKSFVVSKTGKKLHSSNCLHAQNIKKENRKVFKNKTEALNQGYKLCSCLAY